MNTYVYLLCFGFLVLQCAKGILYFVHGIYSFINDRESKQNTDDGLISYARILQGLVTLSVGLGLLYLLYHNIFSPWIILLVGMIFMIFEWLFDTKGKDVVKSATA